MYCAGRQFWIEDSALACWNSLPTRQTLYLLLGTSPEWYRSGVCLQESEWRMHSLIIPALILLGIVALIAGRKLRWPYVSVIVLGLIYFPARVDFQLQPRACQTDLTVDLALMSLRNFPHIVHFAWFFLLTAFRFQKRTRRTLLFSGLIALLMGAAVELAEGITGKGNCRLRDLIPDAAGAFVGALLVLLWETSRQQLRSRFSTNLR